MQSIDLDSFLQDIQNEDHKIRSAARDNAGRAGPRAIAPLAEIATSDDLEVARAAGRAIQNIVYFAGRPGAEEEAAAVTAELLKLLKKSQSATQFHRDVLWMTWQIADESAVETVVGFLTHPELKQDARMALERLPGEGATNALKAAMASATGEQKSALAYSLRVRGVTTPGVEDIRLVPTKETAIQPVGG